jgi:hypothetical protein
MGTIRTPERTAPRRARLQRVDALDRLIDRLASTPLVGKGFSYPRFWARLGLLRRRLFLVLWELPLPLQAGLGSALARRTLPQFEQRHPSLTPMRDLLDPDWIREFLERFGAKAGEGWALLGEELGRLSRELDQQSPIGGDRYLFSAACGFHEAFEPGAAPITVTSACVSAAMCAITAEECEAWELSDPEAASAWRELAMMSDEEMQRSLRQAPWRYRLSQKDPQAQAACFRGWRAAVAWLRSAKLEDYAEVRARADLADAVRQARDLEVTLWPKHD